LSDDNSFAASLRGFGPIGLLAISAIVASNFVMTLLAALLVLPWAYASKTRGARSVMCGRAVG
jgi:hypothetical protein